MRFQAKRGSVRFGLAVAAVCLAALCWAGPASSGIAFLDGSVLRYHAAQGETNGAGVAGFGTYFVVTETVAPLQAGAGCTLETQHTARCPSGGVASVEVSLGDQDDHFGGEGGSAGYSLSIDMGTGDDTVDGIGFSTGATIQGGGGDDALRGSVRFADTVFGGDGDDMLEGDDSEQPSQGGNDTLDGGPGNDTLIGDFGADQLFGGAGTDVANYFDRTDGVFVSLDDVANDGSPGEGDNVHSDVENVFGTGGADVIVGNEGANDLNGWWGDDTISGGGGDDALVGDRGVDDLAGGLGDDQLVDLPGQPCTCLVEPDSYSGGLGTDTVSFTGRADDLDVSLDDAADDGAPGEGDNVHSDIEHVVGGAGDDTIVGSPANETLDGWQGDDVLDGGAGADHLVGGAGFDAVSYEGRVTGVQVTLDGVAGDGEPGENDWVDADVEGAIGGAGADHLTGSNRRDSLLGLGGADVIDGGREEDVLDGGDGDDSITSRELEGFSDSVVCGAGVDGVVADSLDVIASDCEHVDYGGGPPPPPPPPPPPAPALRCRVPKVIGLRLAPARTKIRRAHCSVGRVRRAKSSRAGRVLRQTPKPGARRKLGARVDLVVGRR